MDERDRVDEEAQLRRRRIAAVAIALPILAGIVIAAVVWLAGGEESEVTKPEGETTTSSPHRVEAASAAEAGTPAPRVRLTEGATGKDFDGAALSGEPYAVVFISTRCAAIGGFLRRVATDLGPGEGAVLAISADPALDTPGAARAYLSHAHLEAGGPVYFLIGDEDQLRGSWNAWGFAGPAAKCPDSIPAHLVSAAGLNTGVLDVAPDSPASLLTTPLRGMAK
ncbi:MAG TPA: SCO family protein [Solirubrobacterales bacterium]|jgi:cytochrome oxidase Cu insertion factor (SCO1/SenC/PrrC family)|nr:SCO family protein [Solirubrobacterales bacterium]